MANVGDLKTRISLDSAQFQQSMAGVNRQLQGLKQEQRAVTSSGTGFARGVDELRKKSDVLNRTLQLQKRQVEELRRRYEESRKSTGDNSKETQKANTAYQKAKAEMNKTENALKGITKEIERQTNPWKQLGRNMDATGKKMQDIGRGMTSFGRSWSMYVTAPILGLGAAALKTGMDFQEGMSEVQAISGATGKEFEQLSGQARELGSETRFSATQAAEGQKFLAMAGFETNEVLSAMPGLLDLASSSNMELGRAADIASNIISGFNMEAGEAGRVADVLAKGASTANTNVEQLGGAMKYAAPIASTLDLEIEGLTASVGFMSDAGIQGEQAGRQLRQGLLRLANPTGKAASLIKDLGINVFDADGNMKEMHDVVAELEKGLGDMDSKTRAASLAILFGSESTAGWSTLLDRGSKELENYTKELENSEGAASEMAKIMEDNAKGALREFRSAAEEAGIVLSENLLPVFTDGVKYATDLARQFGELDKDTQKNILTMAGLAATVGPAALILGNMTTAVGGLLRIGGSASKMIGAARGAGLAGRIGLLGVSTGPVALATLAIGALGVGVYQLTKDKDKLHDVSTETADKLWDEADALENLVSKFDELQSQSKLTTDEFGRMIDIQKELEKTQNPARVAELKDEYERLREKSGLSNEQIDKMIELNEDIIEQSPNVEKSFSDKGNAVVESTDAVKEYIKALREMSLQELREEQFLALENEAKIIKENKQLKLDIQKIDEDMLRVQELRGSTEEEIRDKAQDQIGKINTQLLDSKTTEEERIELLKEQGFWQRLYEEGLVGSYELLKESKKELQNKIDLNEDELAKLEEINARMADLLLSEVDINFEKGEGLDKLDERIQKLKDERKEMIENATEEEKKTREYQEQVSELDLSIGKHIDIRDQIYDETGYQSEKNLKTQRQNELLGLSVREMLNMGIEQDNTNIKIGTGIGLAEDLTDELGKDTDKDVEVDDKGTAKKITDEAKKSVTKSVTLSGRWSNIRASFSEALSGIRIPGFKDGTDHHKGGPFIAGEEGFELGRLGNKWEVLNLGMYDRPAGYEVFTHDESKRILSAINNMPAYATGANPPGEANRIVSGLNNQRQVPVTGEAVIYTTVINQVDGKELSRHTYRHVTELQELDREEEDMFA
ncbi:phage tail tape measure protein [Virgibacillus sp. W0430]|uniref:phage tail tape measure protein n=1 Tax=Virgibacillus sp. W0430 TaxID=3391580 RepID=UPI003F4897C8